MKTNRPAHLLWIVCLFPLCCFGLNLDLQFSSEILADPNYPVFPDRFTLLSSSQYQPDNLLLSELLPPPAPPGHDTALIRELDTPQAGFRQHVTQDPNHIQIFYPIMLRIINPLQAHISGTSVFNLDNPETLENVDDKYLVYLRRFDALDQYMQSYDLREPENQSVQWPISNVYADYASLDIVVEDKEIAAELADSERISLNDLSVLSKQWQSSIPLDGSDVYRDGLMDMKDLSILAEVWLSTSGQ